MSLLVLLFSTFDLIIYTIFSLLGVISATVFILGTREESSHDYKMCNVELAFK